MKCSIVYIVTVMRLSRSRRAMSLCGHRHRTAVQRTRRLLRPQVHLASTIGGAGERYVAPFRPSLHGFVTNRLCPEMYNLSVTKCRKAGSSITHIDLGTSLGLPLLRHNQITGSTQFDVEHALFSYSAPSRQNSVPDILAGDQSIHSQQSHNLPCRQFNAFINRSGWH
jgi:hypothetical protein